MKRTEELLKAVEFVFGKQLMKKLSSENTNFPVLDGLMKLNKSDRIEEIPIRPEVVHCNSPLYKIATWLNKYYREVTGFRTKHTIKNSKDLVDKIKNTQANEGYKLKTMDIENSFTNIPTEDLTELIKIDLIDSDLTDDEVAVTFALSKLCMKQIFF
ncbi:hypothetical protein HHI36_008886 [Cryptolaemus montrouzieri]|uniref:Reverse transcriptase domain-containing protein n=1 Tax=Cryptolaemus montrouzieri TaxID=559131 RepID=A0ABD2MTV9_9CUCU